jgi:RNA polymerase sigma-70 factor (sigma-E family)
VDRYKGFAAFVAARGPALSRTAYLLTGDHDAAADLVQSALEKAAAHWRRIAATGDPDAYLRRVMVNQRTSWWRRHRGAEVSGDPPERAIADETGRSIDRLTLATALWALGPRQRAIVVLRFYEDYSVAQTADALGCSIGTVKSQSHDALNRLRHLLSDDLKAEVAP